MDSRGNYLIKPIKGLGHGNFGRVEKVEVYNTAGHLSGEYARKLLSVHPHLLNELFTIDDWRRRFEREVKYQAKCGHDNVVRVYIHHLNTEYPWFVMELAENDLRSEIEANSLNDDEKLAILKMVFKGVEYIHNEGLLHRDLKPENILRFHGNCYKISDFGLIKKVDSQAQSDFLSDVLQNNDMGIGTRKYMSDEAKRGIYTEKSDIYALGVITSEMNIAHIEGITALIDKSAAFTPRSRYDSVAEMITIIDGIIARRG
ncbi:TPA: protein kinase [Kluyvera intermedia]|nr:protein kinase [Kluyvera intermedia]